MSAATRTDERPFEELPEAFLCRPGHPPLEIKALQFWLAELGRAKQPLPILKSELRSIKRAADALSNRLSAEDFRERHGLPPLKTRPIGWKPKKPNSKHRTEARRQLLERDPRCAYCWRPLSMDDATLDHIVPLSKGGANVIENYAIACWHCNQAKDNDAPITWACKIVWSSCRRRIVFAVRVVHAATAAMLV